MMSSLERDTEQNVVPVEHAVDAVHALLQRSTSQSI